MEQRETYNLLYNISNNSNLAALGVAIKDLSNKISPVIEQIDTQTKPIKEYLIKASLRFKPLIDSLKQASKQFVKFLSSSSNRAKQWIKALFTPSILITRRFLLPPRLLIIKRYIIQSFFLKVLSSVITPNAPN